MRKFVLTLRYYSPRAYDYVRHKFCKNLPHPVTIKKWYQQSQVETESGICQRSFELLKQKVVDMRSQGKELICGLVHDEMAIKQHVQYLDATKEFCGFINFGKVPDDCENLPIASNVLMFLLNGISIPFNMPIAYYFVTSLEGIDKVILLTTIIKMLTDIGVIILNSTFDGATSNITACEILGCSYDLDNFHPYFKNPDNDSRIFTFFDPPHMMKLIRNYIGNGNIIYDRLGRAIDWKYFKLLVAIRDKEYFITHKMTRAHLDYQKKNGMKVLLATQTLSSSVASSMQSLLDRKYPGFDNAAGTIEICKRMDILFDIVNSDGERPDNRYKSSISSETKTEIFSFLDDTSDYIKSLTVSATRKPVLESNLKVGFKGMLINMANIKSIYTDFVQTGRLEQFHARRICQCPLESFFSRCRSYSMLGSNTNPTVLQFRSIVRKILVNNEITSSNFANCTDHLQILTVSSGIKKNASNNLDSNSNIMSEENVHENVELIISEGENGNDQNANNENAEPDMLATNETDEATNVSNEEIGIAFIAGRIEQKIKTEPAKVPPNFTQILAENDKLAISFFPVSKQSEIPRRSTYDICVVAHRFCTQHANNMRFNYTEIVKSILTELDQYAIYSKTNFDPHPAQICEIFYSHKQIYIKFIVEAYIKIWATDFAKRLTMENQLKRGTKREQRQKKAAHFRGD